MRKSLRWTAPALLVASVLVALASPAIAAPCHEAAATPTGTRTQAFRELLAWLGLGSWLDSAPAQLHSALEIQTAAPRGEPQPPATEDGPPSTADGGGTLDPDG